MGAMLVRIASFEEITAFISTASGSKTGKTKARISDELHTDWNMPTHAIRIRAAGGPQSDIMTGLLRQRFDTFCYGTNGYEAGRLNRILAACIAPDPGTRPCSFIAANTSVRDVRQEAEPIKGEAAEYNGWDVYIQPFVVTYGSIAV
jgi:hypothetical protein